MARIQLRRDTAANWTAANPTLASGEKGIETDTGKEKTGDGVTAWNTLDYLTAAAGPHKTTHEPGGSDALTVDAAAATGSLRTLGTSATSATAGNDARLSDARTPTAHRSTHGLGGSDALTAADLASGTADATTFLRGDRTWAAPAGGATAGPGIIVAHGGGRYHHPPTSAVGSGALVLNDARLTPLWLPVAVTLDRIGVNVTIAGATSVVRLGIFAANANLTPSSTLILDAGTVDASTTGAKFITISQSVGPGLIWLCGVAQVATCSCTIMTGGQSLSVSAGSSADFTATAWCYSATGISGTFASHAPITWGFGSGNPVMLSVRI